MTKIHPRSTSLIVTAGAASTLVLAVITVFKAAESDAEVEIAPMVLGNIFTEGAEPSVEIESAAESAIWTVADYWGREVAAGELVFDDDSDKARLRLPLDASGHYKLAVRPGDGDESATAYTELALTPDTDRAGAGRDDFVYGAQTHFGHGWDTRLAALAVRIGVERVRDAQQWQEIETAENVYDFSVLEGRYQNYMDELDEHGLDQITEFGLYNANHDDGATPHTDAGRAAFAAFVGEVMDHYGDQIKQVGVLNEPNLPKFGDVGDGPADARPDYYAKLAEVVYEAVKRKRPDVTVAAPEVAAGHQGTDTWMPWLEEFFANDGLDHLDVLALHPYQKGCGDAKWCPPEEGVVQDMAAVRDLMDEYGAGDVPIWATEAGWRADQVSEREQSAYLPRLYVLAQEAGVESLSWYNLADHASGPFGLVRGDDDPLGDYTPRPSYVAYSVMTDQLAGLDYDGRDDSPADVRSYRYEGHGDDVRVMWSPEREQDVRIAVDDPVKVTDTMGVTHTLEPQNGLVTVPLGGDVVYVHCGNCPIETGK
ncbi:MAG: glycosyl hydrolase [Stackebrandtia sp.]